VKNEKSVNQKSKSAMTSSLMPTSAHYDLSLQLQACQSNSRRNGKVARLPFALRQQINRMIEDGLPYKTIIERLGPEGKHLTIHNLSTWRLGGYQDYLNAQAINERARIQTEAAADIVRETGAPDPEQLKRVCSQIALLHYLEAIARHGEQFAREAFRRNPAKLITLINACCNMSNTNIAIEEQKRRHASSSTLPSPSAAGSDSTSCTPSATIPKLGTKAGLEPNRT
jgi:hypothetical protein